MSWFHENTSIDSNDEDMDIDNELQYKTVDDRIIFLIDVRANMFISLGNQEAFLHNIFRFILETLKSLIISNENSSIGILLFGISSINNLIQIETSNDIHEGVITLFSLASLTAARIRQLQSFIDNPKNFIASSYNYSDSTIPPLKQALWCCSNAFNTFSKSTTTSSNIINEFRRIWIFTNDDNPFQYGSTSDIDQFLQVCRDCSLNRIELSLFHAELTLTNELFRTSLFYSKVLLAGSVTPIQHEDEDNDDENDVDDDIAHRIACCSMKDGFDTSNLSIRKKQFKKRTLSKMLMALSLGDISSNNNQPYVISIKIYKLIQIFKKPTHKWLYQQTSERLTSTIRYIDSNTGSKVDTSDISYILPFSNNNLKVDKVEFDNMKAIKSQVLGSEYIKDKFIGIKILYFISSNRLPLDIQAGNEPYFMFPDNSIVYGSYDVFHKLVSILHIKKLIGIITFQRNKSSIPILATMLPQIELIASDGYQISPEGFHIIPLAYSDDIRNDPNNTVGNTSGNTVGNTCGNGQGLIQLIKENEDIIQQGSIMFNTLINDWGTLDKSEEDYLVYENFSNPAIQRYFSVLQVCSFNL